MTCPENEEFVRFFLTRKLNAADEALADHVRTCEDCRKKFEILREIGPAVRKDTVRLRPLARASRRELRSRMGRPEHQAHSLKFRLICAFGASIGLILFGWILFRNPNAADTLRGSERSLPGLAIPQGPLAEAPRLFFWTHVPQGDYYRFELIDDELQSLVKLTTRNAWMLIPETVHNRLRPGRTYLWTVEAVRDDNMKIGDIRGYFEIR
jgi:hypothetical protein